MNIACQDKKCSHYDKFFDDNCGGQNMENCVKRDDTTRLNYLQSILVGKVVCRDSTRWRGFRLHQTSRDDGHLSIRDAIDHFIETRDKEK